MRERYNFVNKKDAFDNDRAGFANRICKLLYIQSGYDVDKAISDGEDIFNNLNEHVRNIYELIDKYIPLMAYYELKEYGKENFDMDGSEYEEAIINTKKACDDYYKDDKNIALDIINSIEETEIPVPIESFFNEDGSHITKNNYTGKRFKRKVFMKSEFEIYDGCVKVSVDITDNKKDDVINAILKWCENHNCSDGETLHQNDNCIINSPYLISHIIDNILKFEEHEI